MKQTVQITLRIADARPILQRAAREAAFYSSLVDHMTVNTANRPHASSGMSLADSKVEWNRKFLAAKRIVNSFGIDPEHVTEEDTIDPRGYVPYIGGRRKLVKAGNFQFVRVEGSKPDPNPKHHKPMYRSQAHGKACDAAAERTVQVWLDTLREDMDTPADFNEALTG